MIILGAGMAGCLSGIINKGAKILEAEYEPKINHNALLRFRTDSISKVVGIPFKKVEVQKSIWLDNSEVDTSVRISNLYSRKVTGHYIKRSIINIDTVTRYVAPHNFHSRMMNILSDNILFGQKIIGIEENTIHTTTNPIYRDTNEVVISTLPINVNAKLLGIMPPRHDFQSNRIYINQFEIDNCDVYSTVYFPGDETDVYRASIAGSCLIVESLSEISYVDIDLVFLAMGLKESAYVNIMNNHVNVGGKIVPIDDSIRKQFLYTITKNYNVYSLGRFATWRNILLDDVLNDVYVINRMINTHEYDLAKG